MTQLASGSTHHNSIVTMQISVVMHSVLIREKFLNIFNNVAQFTYSSVHLCLGRSLRVIGFSQSLNLLTVYA